MLLVFVFKALVKDRKLLLKLHIQHISRRPVRFVSAGLCPEPEDSESLLRNSCLTSDVIDIFRTQKFIVRVRRECLEWHQFSTTTLNTLLSLPLGSTYTSTTSVYITCRMQTFRNLFTNLHLSKVELQ